MNKNLSKFSFLAGALAFVGCCLTPGLRADDPAPSPAATLPAPPSPGNSPSADSGGKIASVGDPSPANAAGTQAKKKKKHKRKKKSAPENGGAPADAKPN